MSPESHQPTPRPTLEDLLRFKRAERPPPEFWAEFDRGLRQKQLAALMKRPQGWARIRPVFVRGLRWAVPATAAAAVALVILQFPRGSSSKQEPLVAAVAPQPIPVDEQPAPSPVVQVAAAVPETSSAAAARAEGPEVVAQAETSPAPAPVQVASAGIVEHTLPWSAASLASSNLSAYRAESLYPVRLTAREAPRRSTSSWTSRFTEMVRELSAEQADARVLQLASLDLPAAGQFGAFAAPIGTNSMVASNDRSSRSLSDRQMRDLDSRFGVKATSVSIKF